MLLVTRLALCAAITGSLIVGEARAADGVQPDGVLVQHTDGHISVAHPSGDGAETPSRLSARAASRRRVRFSEPNYRYSAAATPSDPLFRQQWSLADDTILGAGPAWDQTTGGDVIVAVIDSGVDLDHPDLAGNLWTNAGETAGNGIDDDNNGFVDDVSGWNFAGENANPDDDNGHGTHVAGIIGARGGNGVGIAGVAWQARIMPIKVLDQDAVGSAATLALGIRYAVANGAKIINLSVSGPGYSQAFEEAVQLASESGVIVVGAAGNDGRNVESDPVYPAGFSAPLLLTTAATGQDGALAPVSNFGAATVELAAPGADIVATARGGGYERRTGTSMAAPHVAGALVLLASARPQAGPTAWRDAVVQSARPGLAVGAGTLSVSGALQIAMGTAFRRQTLGRTAAIRRTACALRRARALSAVTKRRNRGRLLATATGGCTSSAGSTRLGL